MTLTNNVLIRESLQSQWILIYQKHNLDIHCLFFLLIFPFFDRAQNSIVVVDKIYQFVKKLIENQWKVFPHRIRWSIIVVKNQIVLPVQMNTIAIKKNIEQIIDQ